MISFLFIKIVRQVDLLGEFPELGATLESRFASLRGLRHLVIQRNWRVVYEFDEEEITIFILAVQHCRQQLQPIRDLKRRKRQID